MKLNLGAGSDARDGYVNTDLVDLPGIDVVHDLDTFPWPFDDDAATEILALDVFEHVDKPLGFVAECWRILAPGGRLHVRAPHWQSPNAATDPTHRRSVTEATFDYWVPGTPLHTSFGAAYAQGRHFRKVSARQEGGNVVFDLDKVT